MGCEGARPVMVSGKKEDRSAHGALRSTLCLVVLCLVVPRLVVPRRARAAARLPAGLAHARNLALVGEVAQHDPADAEATIDSARTAGE